MTTYTRGTPFYKVIIQTARDLGVLWEGVVSNNSATTVVDDILAGMGYNDDHFNGGWIMSNAGNDVKIVTDYTGATGTITTSSWSAVPSVADRYWVATKRYSWQVIAQMIRASLIDMGDVPVVDTSSLTTSSTITYTLPDAACRDLRQVFIATQATTPYYYQQITKWRQHDDQLILNNLPSSGMPIKLIYVGPHTEIDVIKASNVNDIYISDYVDTGWLAVMAAVKCVVWRMNNPGPTTDELTAQFNILSNREQILRPRRIMSWPQVVGRML